MQLKTKLDKIGTIGILVSVLLTPCCFPLFAFGLTALGFGSFELFGSWTSYAFEVLVLISLLGFYFSYKLHKNIFPLVLGIISGFLIFYAFNFNFDDKTIYFGMFGLMTATGFNYFINKKSKKTCNDCSSPAPDLVSESIITCPNCGHKEKEIMPKDSCQYFYECKNCKQIIKPKDGDCCVYCSYGTIPCPQIQNKNCC